MMKTDIISPFCQQLSTSSLQSSDTNLLQYPRYTSPIQLPRMGEKSL